LQSLTFEYNGSKDLLYTIQGDKDDKLVLSLIRRNFTKENRGMVISDAILAAKVKTLFEGKAQFGGVLFQDGKEFDLNKGIEDAPIGDQSSKITLNTIDDKEYLIQAPVITTEGMENLFQELRNFIEESLNPAPKGPEPEAPAPPSDSCKDLKDLEGSVISVKNHEGKTTISSKGALKKIENSDPAVGSLRYEAEETRETAGSKYDICVEYTYNPSTCTLSRQPSGEEKTELQVLSVKQDNTSTKIEASECKSESCTKADILLIPVSPSQ
ncbi:MAG: hypothetical protein KGP28_09870, partial [Bdellovibrionales bacterium]|nr:hypothetical protein [Bdellovibrionales bacterium]